MQFVRYLIWLLNVLLVRFRREPKRGTTIWPECTASTSSTASTRATWPHSSTRTWDGRTWASAGVRPRPSHARPAAGSAWPPRCRCPSSTCAELCRHTRRTRWRSTRDWIRPSRRGWRWAPPLPSPLSRIVQAVRVNYCILELEVFKHFFFLPPTTRYVHRVDCALPMTTIRTIQYIHDNDNVCDWWFKSILYYFHKI